MQEATAHVHGYDESKLADISRLLPQRHAVEPVRKISAAHASRAAGPVPFASKVDASLNAAVELGSHGRHALLPCVSTHAHV
jgi:hypothetical protein